MDERIEKAVGAYQLAIEYRRRVLDKWQKRADAGENLRDIDEFHRTRVAWENDMWRSEKLIERAQEVLLWVIQGVEIAPEHEFNTRWFVKCKNRFFLRAYNAVGAV